MSDVLQTKILYDDRFTHYHNLFTETKVVHKPFLEEYLKEIIPNDDTIIHVIIHDCKDQDNKSYLSNVKELLNKENVVPHIIAPRSYYRLPNCKSIQYYIELGKGTRDRVKKMSELIEQDDNKDNIMLNVTQDINGIILQYSTPSGRHL